MKVILFYRTEDNLIDPDSPNSEVLVELQEGIGIRKDSFWYTETVSGAFCLLLIDYVLILPST